MGGAGAERLGVRLEGVVGGGALFSVVTRSWPLDGSLVRGLGMGLDLSSPLGGRGGSPAAPTTSPRAALA